MDSLCKTVANVNSAVTNLILPQDIVTEIRNSAAAGKTVTVHERPIDFYGKSQIGYVILDPETGAGAYKIGGGENGGEIVLETVRVLNWISFAISLKTALYAVSWGPHATLVFAGINMLTTLIEFGLSCPAKFDTTALAFMTFFMMAIMVLGVLISLIGPFGVAVSIAMAIMLQGANLVLSEFLVDGC